MRTARTARTTHRAWPLHTVWRSVNHLPAFPPTRSEALARIGAVRPADYARTRNAIEGAVTGLSPYITHGFVSLPEVLAGVAARHRLDAQHKFVAELGWREYFRHVWAHRGDAILRSLHEGVLPDHAYAAELPADIRQGRTGVPAIDTAVRTLHATGYLHNHARMWLASYVVHLRKVHWRAGADWMVALLLDGDLASNHLSWQWVAATASSKPYLFNAENVARYAPAAWHSPGSVIDASYEALDAMARSPRAVKAPKVALDTSEPTLAATPPRATEINDAAVAGRDVWLVHPWALGDPPPDLPGGCMLLGWWPTEHHTAWPWSQARWAFVGERMAALAPTARWHATSERLAQALQGARSVQTRADPHVSKLLPARVVQRAPAHLFAEVGHPCKSFSTWWRHATRDVKTLHDLAGLATLDATGVTAPLF